MLKVDLKKSKNTLNGVVMGLLMMLAILMGLTNCGGKSTTTQEIQFNGGSCKLDTVQLNPMFAPADMKEGEKAFIAGFKYTLNSGVTVDALAELSSKGQFVAPDGKAYKVGVTAVNSNIYNMIVAIPKNIDASTLKFVFEGQSIPLKSKVK
jgi:hypothetical protein